MSFPGILRDWLTKINGCINTLGHNGKNLTYVKADGTTGTVGRPVHRYTLPANASKVYYRIAQSSVGQLTPMHCRFIVRAKNTAAVANYQILFVDTEVYGNQCGLRTFGNNNTPLDYVRVLYENTAANVSDAKLTYIDIRPNVQNSQPVEIEIEEVCNDGMIFAVDGALSASTVPSGYENRAVQCYAPGVSLCSSAEYATYLRQPHLVISADTTVESSWTHTRRVLYCTHPVTLTVTQTSASQDRVYWVKNGSTGVVTIHPSTSSIDFDGESADITLQPGELIKMWCQSTGHYVITDDSRWQSKKLDAASANYIKALTYSGKELTATKGDDTTATVQRPIHRYTIAANANKAWWRIAQSSVGQLHPMHCEFILRAKNEGSKDNYQIWHCFVEVYGNASGVHILGGPNLPFSQLRILYENTVANVTDEKLSYIDLYCNQKNSSATEFEIEEIYNDGITFVADGAPSASSIPSGYESRAVGANQSGIQYSSATDTSNYSKIQYTAITADATLAANWSYRMRVLNCTQPVTLTVNQTGAGNDCYHWVKNSSSGVVTIHPATSSIFFDDVSADITLQPGEFLKFHCQSTGHYVILEDGRWKSQKADDADIWDGGTSASL